MANSENEEFKRITDIYNEVSRCQKIDVVDPEIDLEHYLLNTFHAGEFFFFVFCVSEQKMEFCSDSVKHILGIEPHEWTMEYAFQNFHPEDAERFVQNENSLFPILRSIPPSRLCNYKVRYDIRLKAKDGTFKRFLHQARTIQTDDQGSIIRTFCVYTDISYLKIDGYLNVSFVGVDGEPSYYNIEPDGSYSSVDLILTSREMEILQLIARGLKSDEIAALLSISKRTVYNHRNSILQKFNTHSTTEVIQLGMEQGWL